ncbi:hypothetical protein [Shewanella sp. FDAARGOS_354]|nr:hypothetical protein [Shewanella sp. FDAARGOS_354]
MYTHTWIANWYSKLAKTAAILAALGAIWAAKLSQMCLDIRKGLMTA